MNTIGRSLWKLVAVAILPVAVYAAGILLFFSETLEDQAEERLTSLAAVLSQGLDRALHEETRVLAMLAASPLLQYGELQRFREQAIRVLRQEPGWRGIALYDASTGMTLVHTHRPYGAPLDLPVTDPASFEAVLRLHRPVVGSLVPRSQTLPEPFVTLRVPVIQDDEIRFVLTAAIDPVTFSALLIRADLPRSWTAAILDPGLTVVGRTRNPEFIGRKATSSLADAVAQDRTGLFTSLNQEGLPVYTAYRRSDATGWTVALGIPKAEIETSFRRTVLAISLGGLALALVSLFLSILVSRTIQRQTRAEERTHMAKLEAIGAAEKLARRQAEQANLAKSRFLAAASHDLRQPFQAMRLFYHVLGQYIAAPAARGPFAGLGQAMSAGEGLLNALLDISSLEAGAVKPSWRSVPLSQVIEPLAAEFSELAAERGLRFACHSLPGSIRTDPVLLSRILRNLLLNAIRYTSSGGVLLGCRRRGHYVRIEVWDTGMGIPPDQQESVFDDFVQLGNPERDRSKGLGLGLPIARRMAQILGHDLTVRSWPGRGSVFAVLVPCAAETPAAETSPKPAAKAGAQRILVVEDDQAQRFGLRVLLEGWGHEVLTAASSQQALDIVTGQGIVPSLVISDLRLPGECDGIGVVALLRERSGRHIPAIIATGDTDPERIRHIAESGLHLLHKPYSPEVLRELIGRMAAPESVPG